MLCKKCGGSMRLRDYVKRGVKTKGGKRYFVYVERYKCKTCMSTCRVLPDCLLPRRHYEKDIIEGVIEGLITDSTLGYEDYPCAMTMRRWKQVAIFFSQKKLPLL